MVIRPRPPGSHGSVCSGNGVSGKQMGQFPEVSRADPSTKSSVPTGEGISEELAIGPEAWQVFLGPLGLLPATCFLRIDLIFPC